MVFNRRKQRSGNVCKINSVEKEDIEELVLPVSKLRFCGDQLQNLNYIFTKNLSQEQDIEFSKTIVLATSVTERLIQRLVCGIGILDSRFCSKFLIALHDSKINNASPTLEYIIRLDSLSQPSLYVSDELPKYSITEGDVENCPPGYARIRLHPPCNKAWAEFINPMGYLRRDKIQAKIVELLALAASGNSPISSLLVDESVLCGSPGKVVDAFTLFKILQRPADQHVFYGEAGKNPRYPDPRDFKLAIVDKPSGICMRIGFSSPALAPITIQVRLLVGIGLEAWPSTSSFPFRVTLSHADSVLYHRAAQTGMYLTGYGVHSSAWQVRLPAAESCIEKHYSTTSAVTVILRTLSGVPRDIDEEYRKHQVDYKILNSYTMRSCLFYELEEDTAIPTEIILNWSPLNISMFVLRILDKLIQSLRNQNQSNYFFPTANLFVNPGHLCEDDFILESNKIKAYMLKLFDMSLTSLETNEDFNKFLVMQKMEMNLLRKWKDLVDGLVPTPLSRKTICTRRLKVNDVVLYSQYTPRQVEYIAIVLKNILMVKHLILQTPDEVAWSAILKFSDQFKENAIEDIIYILVALIEQARDEYLERLPKTPKVTKKLPYIKHKIETAISGLMELLRKENEITNGELVDDDALVHVILKSLHKGLEYNKKYLRKVLKPYIKKLFVASHCTSWHLEALQCSEAIDEAEALCMFSTLVNSGRITPAQGLVDSVIKNWTWAKNMLHIVEDGQLRLLFVPGREKSTKHILHLPPNEKNNISKSMHDLKTNHEYSTLNRKQCYFSALLVNSQNVEETETVMDFKPPQCVLKDSSPMKSTFSKFQRNGEHRCCGDVLETLLAMQKVNVVREVSTLLPNEERIEIMEAIQKLQNERSSRPNHKTNSSTIIRMKRMRKTNLRATSTEDLEKYTPKEESAGIQEIPTDFTLEKRPYASKRWTNKDAKMKTATLIGSCRAARIREDTSIIHFQDNFKMQPLKKHSSFKY